MLNSEYTTFDNMKEGTKYTQPVLVTSMEGCNTWGTVLLHTDFYIRETN